jgi:hypothetical protein
MTEKSDVKAVASTWGAVDGVVDVADAVADGVGDELHAVSTRPSETTAPVTATDLRTVPMIVPPLARMHRYVLCIVPLESIPV